MARCKKQSKEGTLVICVKPEGIVNDGVIATECMVASMNNCIQAIFSNVQHFYDTIG